MRTSDRSRVLGMLRAWSAGALTFASPIFPPAIAEEIGADEPVCTVCHANPSGGLGTATKPFALYLVSRGLRVADEAALRSALAAASGEQHDTDGDGLTDVEALRAGKDPNGDSDRPEPAYGCFAAAKPSRPSSASLPLLLGFAVLLSRLLRFHASKHTNKH